MAARLSTLFVSSRSGTKHATTSSEVAGPGRLSPVAVEDGWPILGLFGPVVLGSGEGDRGWVLAITDGLVPRLGTAIREGILLLRLWSQSASADTRAAWEDDAPDGLDRRRSLHRPGLQ